MRTNAGRTKIVGLLLLTAIVIAPFVYLPINPLRVFAAFPRFVRFMYSNFLPPNFDGITAHFPVILRTLLFAVVGTYISAFLAFFLALFIARETCRFTAVRGVLRFIISFFRNVPLLVWGTVLVFIFGIGSLVGVVALVLATLGFLARSYADSIDEIGANKLEGLKSTGAGYWQILVHGLLPEFIPSWINWTLFAFEINIRASAVLGMVGAGGLGLLIQVNLDFRSFRRAMALVILLIGLVFAAEILTNLIRRVVALQQKTNIPPLLEKAMQFGTVAALVWLFLWSSRTLELNFAVFATRFMANAQNVLPQFIAFNPEIVGEVLYQLMISMLLGICGLVLGAVVSIVLSFLAASNTTPFAPLGYIIKGAVSVIRAVPSLVLILMVVASLGFGHTTAVVGLMFSSLGYLTRAFIASIEEQDFGIIEAMRATGATRLQIITHGLLPGLATSFIAWLAIRLESNIADSVSLGIVGAGGVGMLIARFNRQLNMANLATTIYVVFGVMVVLEVVSNWLRKSKT